MTLAALARQVFARRYRLHVTTYDLVLWRAACAIGEERRRVRHIPAYTGECRNIPAGIYATRNSVVLAAGYDGAPLMEVVG